MECHIPTTATDENVSVEIPQWTPQRAVFEHPNYCSVIVKIMFDDGMFSITNSNREGAKNWWTNSIGSDDHDNGNGNRITIHHSEEWKKVLVVKSTILITGNPMYWKNDTKGIITSKKIRNNCTVDILKTLLCWTKEFREAALHQLEFLFRTDLYPIIHDAEYPENLYGMGGFNEGIGIMNVTVQYHPELDGITGMLHFENRPSCVTLSIGSEEVCGIVKKTSTENESSLPFLKMIRNLLRTGRSEKCLSENRKLFEKAIETWDVPVLSYLLEQWPQIFPTGKNHGYSPQIRSWLCMKKAIRIGDTESLKLLCKTSGWVAKSRKKSCAMLTQWAKTNGYHEEARIIEEWTHSDSSEIISKLEEWDRSGNLLKCLKDLVPTNYTGFCALLQTTPEDGSHSDSDYDVEESRRYRKRVKLVAVNQKKEDEDEE